MDLSMYVGDELFAAWIASLNHVLKNPSLSNYVEEVRANSPVMHLGNDDLDMIE